MANIDALNEKFEHQPAEAILRWAFEHFDPRRIALSTSFGAEGLVLIHTLVSMRLVPCIFTIDTGRHFPETYEIWDEVVRRYGLAIECYSPSPEDLSRLLAGHGPNLFYESVELRKACCRVRKVLPLQRALRDTDLWISALRKERGRDVRVVAVELEESPVLSGGEAGAHLIQGIGAGFVPRNYAAAVVDEVIRFSSADAIATARAIARIRCGKCLRVCPTGAINLRRPELVRQPVPLRLGRERHEAHPASPTR
ncbi:MAG: phosphoadenosine phosphosulfate reductase family protein [Polyangiaceae bacterium]|nr:phosphoadenosine phosphosulfate reductase family protein [Polyangiaceae bacterium]